MRIIRPINRDKKSRRNGAALVEMALVLPIFVTVVLGIVEFGRGMMVAQMLTNAAREGARKAIIDGSSNSQVETLIEDFLQDAVNVDPNDVTITIMITPDPANDTTGNEVANAQSRDLITITVAVPFDKISYITGNWLNGKLLHSTAAMRHE